MRFTPAEFEEHGQRVRAATVAEFFGGIPGFHTELYATDGTLLSPQESIEPIGSLGAKFTPELKGINRGRQGNPIVLENKRSTAPFATSHRSV